MQEHIEAVQRMQDYIDAHLNQSITLAELSKASRYSPWYSYRLFIRCLNTSPADYIRRLRLSRSALRLRDEQIKIIDAAYDAGFDSVDGYQRAFFREFGCNPGQYATHPVPIWLFRPYGVKYALRKETPMDAIKTVFIQKLQKPPRKVIIKRGVKATDYFAYCEEVGCDIWGLLTSIKSISGEPVCLWLPQAYIKAGSSQYVMGTEVDSDYSGIIPEGFDVISLPAADYLMFQGEPFLEEDYCAAIDTLQAAIAKYDPKLIGYRWDEANPRIQLEPIGTRGYIELLPVAAI